MMSAPSGAPARPRPASVTGIAAWFMYDWANSAFATVITTFVFSVYFAQDIYGDAGATNCAEQPEGSALWGLAIGTSGLAVALLSPVLGAIADRAGRRKPWLLAFLLLTVGPTALLWYALPSPAYVVFALTCVVIASIAFELGNVFYNAMLPDVAPPHLLGRLSGWGWGLGYMGGLACLATALFGLIGFGDLAPLLTLPQDDSEHIRATALLVAIWFTLFALPLFLLTPDKPSAGVPLGQSIRLGLATLWQTLREVRRYGQIVRFLIASALYRDGLATLFAVGGLYAACTYGMSFSQILIFAIGLNVASGLGAAGFAFLDDRLGSRPTILTAIVGLIGFGIPLLLLSDPTWFIALALGLGLFVGPAQAASRSLLARLAPPHMATEMFGLYAFTGKSLAFVGPIAFATVTAAFSSQRAGMATILVFLALGGLVLLTVREPPHRQASP